MKNKCGRLLRLLIVIIFCIGSIVGLSACSGNKGNEDIDPPNQEIPSDPSLDTIFDSDGTGADTNGLTYQKFISRSKKYKIAWITGYNGSDYADVVIPETVDKGYTVTKIEEKAFENSNISSVIMPSQLEEIGSYAFRNCQFLQEIDLGEVVSIENHAFYGCSGLPSITMPDSVTSIGRWGETDISIFDAISPNQKSYCIIDAKKAKWFFDSKLLKYNAVYDRKIRVGESFKLKIFYNNQKIGNSIIVANLSLGMIDSNGRYWLQPLFIANDNVYDSYNVSGKYYNALLNTDNALKCFKDPYLW